MNRGCARQEIAEAQRWLEWDEQENGPHLEMVMTITDSFLPPLTTDQKQRLYQRGWTYGEVYVFVPEVEKRHLNPDRKVNLRAKGWTTRDLQVWDLTPTFGMTCIIISKLFFKKVLDAEDILTEEQFLLLGYLCAITNEGNRIGPIEETRDL